MIDCAQAGDRLIKVADISERLGITKQNVFKIAHILSRAGFIASVRGPSGGVKLSRPPNGIKVGDVVRAIEVTSVEITGDEGDDAGGDVAGPITGVFDEALSAFIAVLDQHTLADLARASGKTFETPNPAAKKKRRGSLPVASREPAITEAHARTAAVRQRRRKHA